MNIFKLILLVLSPIILMAHVSSYRGAGASFPSQLYFTWIYYYNKSQENIHFNYQSIGSSGGVKQVFDGLVDFGASDKPLKSKELQEKDLIQFPSIFGAIAISYNLPTIGNKNLNLSRDVLADIFSGQIKRWGDERIAKDNPDTKLPDIPIHIVTRSDGSGTTYNFTYFLDKVSERWHKNIGYGKSVKWPTGNGAKGNEGMATVIKYTKGSIGYISYGYSTELKLQTANIENSSGKFIYPTKTSLIDTVSHANLDSSNDFTTSSIDLAYKDAYPLITPTYILLSKKRDKKTLKEVYNLFKYSFENGDENSMHLGFIPLSEEAKKSILLYIKDRVKL